MPRLHGYRYYRFVDDNWMIDDEPRCPGDRLETVSLAQYGLDHGVPTGEVLEFAAARQAAYYDYIVMQAALCAKYGHPRRGFKPNPHQLIHDCAFVADADLYRCQVHEKNAALSTRTPERQRLVIIAVTVHHRAKAS